MIDDAILFLQRRLNRALQEESDPAISGSAEAKVVLPDGTKLRDAFDFKLGAVTLLLLSIEEERALRPDDAYLRVAANGARQKTSPEVRLNLNVLLVSHFQEYGDSLKYLSRIIQHVQAHRVMNRVNSPDLSDHIQQLVLELVTPSWSELNEIWGSLRTACRPCALYRVKMLVFRADETPPAAEVGEMHLDLREIRA
ncbi:MAG TPA: DUF4255 domain-containing protein [Verrucomicrobiota bacterium]|nr:hypothetical protein [Verrucomicrobiales bacterium]HRI15301.1 DUF4255 domain-containing protein [Verrucomicrobiota bacterium]